MFPEKLVNRRVWPAVRVLVVEDDLEWAERVLAMFGGLYGAQGRVAVSVAADAEQAFYLMARVHFDLVILDHDLQRGNGVQLLALLSELELEVEPPVIAHSGIPANNEALAAAGAFVSVQKGVWHELEAAVRGVLG